MKKVIMACVINYNGKCNWHMKARLVGSGLHTRLNLDSFVPKSFFSAFRWDDIFLIFYWDNLKDRPISKNFEKSNFFVYFHFKQQRN